MVASKVGGIPEIIQSGKNGLLINDNKAETITAAIEEIYSNKKLRKAMSKEAIKTIKQKYNIANWITKIENVYFGLVKRD